MVPAILQRKRRSLSNSPQSDGLRASPICGWKSDFGLLSFCLRGQSSFRDDALLNEIEAMPEVTKKSPEAIEAPVDPRLDRA